MRRAFTLAAGMAALTALALVGVCVGQLAKPRACHAPDPAPKLYTERLLG